MKLEELNETSNSFVYHVTFTKNVKKIENGGLKPLQTSNWIKGDKGNRYNKEGGVFAFEHPEDAFKWAFKQNFEFKKPVSIVKLKKGKSWEKDPSEDITFQLGKGQSLRSMRAIPASDVVKSFDFGDFKTPTELKISQEEWFKRIVDTLEK